MGSPSTAAAISGTKFGPPPSVQKKMPYYEPEELRSEQLNVRIPKSVYDGLKDLARLWTHLEQTRADTEAKAKNRKVKPVSKVSVSDVVVRLLQVGLNGAWAEIGMHPQTEREWAEVLARADRLYAQSTSKK